MAELLLIALAAALVNNFVLVQFLGVCPFLSGSQRVEGAIGMGLATGLVLTMTAGLTHLVDRYLLRPFDVQYLRLLAFIVVIGVAVWLTDLLIRRFSPLLQRVLGLYVPLVASNCAVLGVALLSSIASRSFVATLFYGAGAALGFGLAFAERRSCSSPPASCRSPSWVSRASRGSEMPAIVTRTGLALAPTASLTVPDHG
jgi:electron transport complex protein RnfA